MSSPALLLTALMTLGFAAHATSAVAGQASSPTLPAGDSAADAANAPFARFVRLDEGLYRGAQPDADGFRYLRDLGIGTVISFRNDVAERELVEALGMRFVSIPVTFRAFGLGDDFDVTDVRQFLSIVDDPQAGPIFFHCKRGADRTGSFAAIYRIARQGWTADKALDEARDLGMRWWYFPMRGMVKSFAQDVRSATAVEP